MVIKNSITEYKIDVILDYYIGYYSDNVHKLLINLY